MARPQRFSQQVLNDLDSLALKEVFNALGLHWTLDVSFKPLKSKSTSRVNITVGERCFELLVTGPKWYDTRIRIGGGGAISLTMHLYCVGFVDAVKKLQSLKYPLLSA